MHGFVQIGYDNHFRPRDHSSATNRTDMPVANERAAALPQLRIKQSTGESMQCNIFGQKARKPSSTSGAVHLASDPAWIPSPRAKLDPTLPTTADCLGNSRRSRRGVSSPGKISFEKASHGHVGIKARRRFRASVAGRIHNRAVLALPDVLTARAEHRLHGMLLFQRLPTNWTISLAHFHTCLSSHEWAC
jgi:hypothetical protein